MKKLFEAIQHTTLLRTRLDPDCAVQPRTFLFGRDIRGTEPQVLQVFAVVENPEAGGPGRTQLERKIQIFRSLGPG